MSLLVLAVIAAAQVPNIASDSRPLGSEKKFFVFHQQGVSLQQARSDIGTCTRYVLLQTGSGVGILPPYFIPWTGIPGPSKPQADGTPKYGIIGALIAGPLDSSLGRSRRQMSMSRCMGLRGYSRYRVSEGLWKELNETDLPRSIELQAQLASGPAPTTPRVLP